LKIDSSELPPLIANLWLTFQFNDTVVSVVVSNFFQVMSIFLVKMKSVNALPEPWEV
jgi:hypothetical protein